MTTEEKVDKLEGRFTTLEQLVAMTVARVDALIEESKQQREDIRRLHERQDKLQEEHNAEIKAMQEKSDAKFSEMNQRFYDKVDSDNRGFMKQLHSNFVQTMIGFGAIALAVGGLVFAALKQ